jgi:DNA polymerase III epsilon subunit-like protein
MADWIFGALIVCAIFFFASRQIDGKSSSSDESFSGGNRGSSNNNRKYRAIREEISELSKRPAMPVDLSFPVSVSCKPSIMVFDVETTGLPPAKSVTDKNYVRYPRIVQIAWMVFDKEMGEIKERSYIIRQSRKIPAASISVHGITDDIADQKGVDISMVLEEFIEDVRRVDILVGHNVNFDKNVVISELMRANINDFLMRSKETFCTMLNLTEYCAIEKYDGSYKWPSLKEAFESLYPLYLGDDLLHDALSDVRICAKCLDAMWRKEIV